MKELKDLGLKGINKYNGVEVNADFGKIFEILHSVHTLENLSI
jgi:hypothetical protein